MAVELSTALAGLSAAQEKLRASANNVALASTKLVRTDAQPRADINQGAASEFQLQAQDPDLARSLVEQRTAAYQFIANLRVLQTQLRLSGVMLDIYV
ncbi:flagellar hook protein FlgE [Inhella inkyongensis]|uniref:Flagellar hook protein FlgE n=1 Tax=Inhella inkyongensis TaxID=392593 RepID=A0A840S9W4_9BURK|nr:hypothetical protein [Inhella inkyongensis]MBB5205301.1 flagellar hook protein FlgE [Inhella inkyongensis]